MIPTQMGAFEIKIYSFFLLGEAYFYQNSRAIVINTVEE